MNFADQEELAERQSRRQHKRQTAVIWNGLTALFGIAAIAAIVYFGLLFANPTSSLNPYPPPTLPALVQIATSTPTMVELPATWTPVPSSTPADTLTPTQVPATATFPVADSPTPLLTDSSAKYPFASKGDPAPMANTVFHPDSNCNWQGIAGQVWDIQGRPLVGIRVHLQGYYNGKTIDMTTLSGGAQAWYGESGYEFVLGDTPIDSTGQLSIQLNDQAFMAISNKVIVNTYADCSKNLVLVNFQQVR